MRHIFSTILFLLSLCTHAETIVVSDQRDFDALSTDIVNAIRKGAKDVTVDIRARQLAFADDQIHLSGIRDTSVTITIHGNGATIMSQGKMVQAVTSPTHTYLCGGELYNPWTAFQQLSDTISIVDKVRHICRITTPQRNKKNNSPTNQYIQYTTWYTSNVSPITTIDKRHVYFDAGEWAAYRGERTYHVNMEYAYAKRGPRYRIFGVKPAPTGLYECTASTLVHLAGCHLRSFTLDGIHVVGSSATAPLIFLNHNDARHLSFRNSTFRYIGGSVLLDRVSHHVEFADNIVDTFMGHGIVSESGASGLQVLRNTFSHCSMSMIQGFAVLTRSADFTISDNTITDFTYGGIGIGIWGGSACKDSCYGLVTDNELSLSDDFRRNIDQYSLMDSGAIYTWTRCDGVTIARNYIHDISGIKDNRGIFCDDGTRNVTIEGNRIERIANSYDIDLRWSDYYKKHVPDHNTGNVLNDNVTTGKVRFETQRR